jgi:hypothetical protein
MTLSAPDLAFLERNHSAAMITAAPGTDAPGLNLRLFRVMQGKALGPLSWFGAELEEEEFLQAMADEGRLIYQFEVQRSYGLH